MAEKILFVDDEPNILKGFQRVLSGTFAIETATSGEDGLELIARNSFAVVVSDMRMPTMDGIQFLGKVKEIAPDAVRMMLTGNGDQQTAIDAINTGNIFRFLQKPCSPTNLEQAIHAGIQQYRLIMAEKELLEKTLTGCVKTLTDVLSMVNPLAFSRASRVRRLAISIASKLNVQNIWQVEMAAMLSQIGCVSVPEGTLAKVCEGASISNEELAMVQGHPQVGSTLLSNIPRLEPVAEMIEYQQKLFDGSGLPRNGKRGEDIPFGSRIIKVAIDFDGLIQSRLSHYEANRRIQEKSGSWYDPTVVNALCDVFSSQIKLDVRSVRVNELTENMVLAEDLVSVKGVLLVTKGQEASMTLRLRLENYVKNGFLLEPVRVFIRFAVLWFLLCPVQ